MLLWRKVLDKWLTLFNMKNITLWILYILNTWLIRIMNAVGIKCLNQFENMFTKCDKQVQVWEKGKVQSLDEIEVANISHSCLSALAVSLGSLKLYNDNK